MLRQVALIVLAAMVLATFITLAFGDDDPASPGVAVEWIVDDGDGMTPMPATATPSSSATAPTQPASTSVPVLTPLTARVTGFIYPISGACLPDGDSLMPGAPRVYRMAIHEGIDFYDSDNCASIGIQTEVVAAKEGVVVRADWTYRELTSQTLAEFEALVEETEGQSPAAIDAFRGRQVWIEHQDGTVTRYAHLAGIAESIVAGVVVGQGDLVGFVGDSGTPESITDPGVQVHVHFEIRVGEGYLGQGLSPDAVRGLYLQAFSRADA